jgi:sec-independent protein translocase protein TatA
MGSLSIWHWIVVIAVVLLLFGRGKISDLMGDVAQGIKAFKKGMREDDTAALDKSEPAKSIEHSNPASSTTTTRSDVGSKAV